MMHRAMPALTEEEQVFFFIQPARYQLAQGSRNGQRVIKNPERIDIQTKSGIRKQRPDVGGKAGTYPPLELPDVDFWYSVGVRTEIHGTCGC